MQNNMEMEEDSLPDPTSEFGELFEGETAVFESALSEAEALGLENGIETETRSTESSKQHQPYQHDEEEVYRTSSSSGGAGGISYENNHEGHSNQISIDLGELNQLSNFESMGGIREEGGEDVEDGINIGDLQFLPEEYIIANDEDDNDEEMQEVDEGGFEEDPLELNSQEDITGSNECTDVVPYSDVMSVDSGEEKATVVKDVKHFAKSTIKKYLIRRGYWNPEAPGACVPKEVPKSFFAEQIDAGISRVNAITYGPNYRAEEIGDEIEKFWQFYTWMKARNQPMSAELKPMLMPLLVYFFCECCAAGKILISYKLIKQFSRKLLEEHNCVENCQILVSMAKVKRFSDIESDDLLNDVYNKEHTFMLSEWTFTKMKKFLTKLTRPLLINLFSSYFVIDIKSCQEVAERFIDHSDEINSGSDEIDDDENEGEEEDTVQRVINRVRRSVNANLPTITVYTTNGKPICGAVSPQATTVAYGMSGTGIRVCSTSSAKQLLSDVEAAEDTPYTPSLRTVNGHEGSVYGVAFHPRTKLLFSVGQDKLMRAWDLNTESTMGCKVVYRGHLGPVWSIDITHSGQLIATGSMDTSARIWIPERIDCVRILAGHHFDVDCVKFHPNEAYVGTGSVDKSVRFWSVSDGNMARVMTGGDGRISSLAFHQSGKYLAGGGEEARIFIWDIAEGEILIELPCSTHSCKDLTFYGCMLSACFRNGSVQVWNLRQIVGGDDICRDESFVSDYEFVSAPCTIESEANSLFKLYYKDACNLYCLGSDPPVIANSGNIPDENTTFVNESISVRSIPRIKRQVPTSPSSNNDSPTYECLSNNSSPTATSESEIPTSILTSDDAPEDLIDYCLDEDLEDDAENPNITISSSDLDFEVDDQVLQSLVDGSLLLQP